MTNFEYYRDEIQRIADRGHSIAVVNGFVTDCWSANDPDCEGCAFADAHVDCTAEFIKWLYEEYAESKIQIPIDTPIDTKVLVSDTGRDWYRRHYAGCENGKHYVWAYGGTSWTCDSRFECKYMKLAEEEE